MKAAPERGDDDVVTASSQSDALNIAFEIAGLHTLDAKELNRRWRSLVGGPVPAELGRPLTLRILAYKLQAQRLGDLDRVCVRALGDAVGRKNLRVPANNSNNAGQVVEADLSTDVAAPVRSLLVRPGTLLVREHGGVLHRVMVLDRGVVERKNLRQPQQGRLRHYRYSLEWPSLFRPPRQAFKEEKIGTGRGHTQPI